MGGQKDSSCQRESHTPDERVTPISFRNLDQILSVPSPSVRPRPFRNLGLYIS